MEMATLNRATLRTLVAMGKTGDGRVGPEVALLERENAMLRSEFVRIAGEIVDLMRSRAYPRPSTPTPSSRSGGGPRPRKAASL